MRRQSFLHSSRKRSVPRGLVSISASCSAPATWPTSTNLDATFSLMKCTSTSICLVRAWNTGLEASATALVLSHHSWCGVEIEIPSSVQRECSQRRSVVAVATERYSDSALLRETTSCFLDCHKTKLDPKKMQCPPVERLLSEQPAQSASAYASRQLEEEEVNCKPAAEVPFRYLSSRLHAIQ